MSACDWSSTVPPMAEFTCANAALQKTRHNNAIVRPVVTSLLIGVPPIGIQYSPDHRFCVPSRLLSVNDTRSARRNFWMLISAAENTDFLIKTPIFSIKTLGLSEFRGRCE